MAKGTKTGGRKAGTPNKLTKSVKEAIETAFSAVGGPEYLTRVAQEDPKTFCALLGKVIPMQVTGDAGGPLEIVCRWKDGENG